MSVNVVFFFKQKTAYEMRISDWSSDVCSSDLTSSNAASGRWHVESRDSVFGIGDSQKRGSMSDTAHGALRQNVAAPSDRGPCLAESRIPNPESRAKAHRALRRRGLRRPARQIGRAHV